MLDGIRLSARGDRFDEAHSARRRLEEDHIGDSVAPHEDEPMGGQGGLAPADGQAAALVVRPEHIESLVKAREVIGADLC